MKSCGEMQPHLIGSYSQAFDGNGPYWRRFAKKFDDLFGR